MASDRRPDRISDLYHAALRRAAVTSTIVAVIALGAALHAGQPAVPSVQYRSQEGVEYRSLPDTDAVKSTRAALDASPRNIARIIDLGVAQSGARQFREAIATFTRGLEIEPDNAVGLPSDSSFRRWSSGGFVEIRLDATICQP